MTKTNINEHIAKYLLNLVFSTITLCKSQEFVFSQNRIVLEVTGWQGKHKKIATHFCCPREKKTVWQAIQQMDSISLSLTRMIAFCWWISCLSRKAGTYNYKCMSTFSCSLSFKWNIQQKSHFKNGFDISSQHCNSIHLYTLKNTNKVNHKHNCLFCCFGFKREINSKNDKTW